MTKKHIWLLMLIALVIGLAGTLGRLVVRPSWDAQSQGSHFSAAQRVSSAGRAKPSHSPGAFGDEAQPLELCGQVPDYDPSAGPAIVSVSIALPGTGHPTRTVAVAPDGRWELSAVPRAPIQVAVTVPGVPATSLYIAEPEPCATRVYSVSLSPGGPATLIRGTVSDVFGGPVANAQVEVIPSGTQNGFGFKQPAFRVATDDDGRFAITVLANEYVVHGSHAGYSSASVDADTSARELVEVALVLHPAAVVSGRVVRADDGAPVPHAELRLVKLTNGGSSSVSHIAPADAVAGADGRFVVEGVGAGSWAIHARTDDAITSTPTEVSIELFDDVRDVVVVVEDAPRVHGIVRERDTKQPVAGALVLLQSEMQSLSCSPSDAEGTFDCAAVAPGNYTASVAHEEYAGNLLGAIVRIDADPRYLELEVERGHTISGRVSPPVAGVPIRVRMDLDLTDMGFAMMNAFRTARTDASGEFRIGPLSLGEVTLVAEHIEHGRGEARVDRALAKAGGEIEIVLGSAASLVGRVTNLGDTNGASLQLTLTPVEEPMRIDGTRGPGASMYAIAITELGDFSAKGIEPGSYALQLQHSRGPVSFTGPERVELSDGEPRRIELELTAQQRRFAGVVVDEDGGPVEGAVVYLPADPSTRAVSDVRGEFALAAWSDSETVAVRFHRAGFSTAASDATLQAGAQNQLVVPAVTTLEVAHAGVESGRLIVTGQTRIERPAARSGVTTITGLLAGRYVVHVCGREGYGHAELELRGAKAALTVDTQPWVLLEGVALGPEGEPLAGAQILAVPVQDPCNLFRAAALNGVAEGLPTTQDDGGFTLTGLPPGPTLLHFIDVTTDPPRELSTTIEIPSTTASHELGNIHL
jgi:hypothetical protein